MTDFDPLIDAAAREMTAGPSSVDLRARVIEEIRAGGTSLQARHAGYNEAKASYHKWWLAAAAGILLAAYLGWPARQPVELPAPPPVVQRQDGPRPAAPPSDDGTPPPLGRAAAPGAPVPTFASIPALEAPPAIGISPLDTGPTPVPLPALDVDAPLEIETLDIKPLVSPPPATGGQ
jgi:hypothetical protein